MKIFENPRIEIMTMEVEDVITTSGGLDEDETLIVPAGY